LRLPRAWLRKRKIDQVALVVSQLKLQKCENTPISLISGGEKKRLNIGSELLTRPKIMILDEPTSGLDSTTASSLVSTLKALAGEGLTVITSIHQPNSSIFFSFDKLLLLADGEMIYSGRPRDTILYFAIRGLPCPE